MGSTTVAPAIKSIAEVFSSKTYYIDFYQRKYKWGKEPVETLLDDIFRKFAKSFKYSDKSNKPKHQDEVRKEIGKYEWYYLSSYMIQEQNGKNYIVDGQQRLTTILIIFIVLSHLCKHDELDGLPEWINDHIRKADGGEKQFAVFHDKENGLIEQLFNGDKSVDSLTKSGENMLQNYNTVIRYLRDKLKTARKFQYFVYYFMERVFLVSLEVANNDAPMLFEVINDRGTALRPYELLKGSLLSRIDKNIAGGLEKFSNDWDNVVARVNSHYYRKQKNKEWIDDFFYIYLCAKKVTSYSTAKNINRSNYHKDFLNKFQLDTSKAVISFLENDFPKYANLYCSIRSSYSKYKSNDWHGYDVAKELLILSFCEINDFDNAPIEESTVTKKIEILSKAFDRLYMLARLQNFSINDDDIYSISPKIRNQEKDYNINAIFNEYLENKARNNAHEESIFSYSLFRNISYFSYKRNFLHHFFERIEEFLAKEIKRPQVSGGGYGIEHILANNDEVIKEFTDKYCGGKELEGRDKFETERNRLGALLLLKSNDNKASGNETYQNKLKTYASCGVNWNETLTEGFYQTNKDFEKFIEKYPPLQNIRPLQEFGPAEIEERQKLLFEMSKIIWDA